MILGMLLVTPLFAKNLTNPHKPSISVVFSTQDPVPGGAADEHFTSFGNPAINDFNHVAYLATVSNLSSRIGNPPAMTADTQTKTWSGIWADDIMGKRKLVVRTLTTTSPFPMLGGNGFKTLSDPVYNNSETLAFIGTWYSDSYSFTDTFHGGTGVWTSKNLTQPVAFVGQPTPVAPGVVNTFLRPIGYVPPAFDSFIQIALPDQGGVVIWANVLPGHVAGDTPATQKGIFAQDTLGRLQPVAIEGDTLLVGGSNKTIATLSFMSSSNSVGAQTRHFSQYTGNILYTATFTDGSQAAIKVQFP